MGKGAMNQVLVSSKRQYLQKLLAEGPTYVHVDPRKAGVVIPHKYAKQVKLTLVFGYTLPKPTDDLNADNHKITATLSFDQENFLVVLPWTAVYALSNSSGDGMIWAEDVPPEIQERSIAEQSISQDATKKRSSKPTFGVIDGGANRPIATRRPRQEPDEQETLRRQSPFSRNRR